MVNESGIFGALFFNIDITQCIMTKSYRQWTDNSQMVQWSGLVGATLSFLHNLIPKVYIFQVQTLSKYLFHLFTG